MTLRYMHSHHIVFVIVLEMFFSSACIHAKIRDFLGSVDGPSPLFLWDSYGQYVE